MVARKVDLLAIVGPTASGKTALSIAIAKKYGGEIVAVDSRTVYKHMDIGTAKPTKAEKQGIPHWGLDLAGPGQKMTVADYKEYASKKIAEIKGHGCLPIMVGGSGLYIDAMLYDFKFAPTNETLRQLLSELPVEDLQQEIRKRNLTMPENCQNKRYLIRAIERGNNILINKPLNKGTLVVGIDPGRELLKQYITARAIQMIDSGVVNEAKRVAKLYGWGCEAMTAGVYKVLKSYIDGQISQDEAINEYIKSDLRLAKKQMTWFKRNEDIRWFSAVTDAEAWLDTQLGVKLK